MGLPPSGHVRSCPYCHNETQFNKEAEATFNTWPDPKNRTTSMVTADAKIYRCVVCCSPLFGYASDGLEDTPRFYPAFVSDASTDIPTKVRDIFLEVLACSGVKAWNAAATMCRRTVQECVIDKGGEGKDLYNQIEDLAQKQILTPDLKEWAHAIRIIGKQGAHADVFVNVDEPEAKDALDFTEELLRFVYVVKARFEKRKSGHTAPTA